MLGWEWLSRYYKLASEIGTDVVSYVKQSKLTSKTKDGVKKLSNKIKENKEKRKTEEKKDAKQVAKAGWSWLTAKTKSALNSTKEYLVDIKEEFDPRSERNQKNKDDDSDYSYYSYYTDEESEEEEKKEEVAKEEVAEEEVAEEVDPDEP